MIPPAMRLLYTYLRRYWTLVVLALVLAAINQIFSLLDPLIFRHVIDRYATRYQEYTTGQFTRGVSLLLAAAVGVACVSRLAKNFQDYFVNVVTQRLGADLYSDGVRHSLELPYALFEDQRSGETLGRLQKVRSDVEKLIAVAVNTLFTTLVGVGFVMVYSFSVHWLIAPVFLLTIPVLGVLSSVLSKRIKKIQKVIVAETTSLAGSTTESLRNIELVKSLGLARQEIERLNAITGKILRLELRKVRWLRLLGFIQGTGVYGPRQRRILYNGKPGTAIDLDELRAQIGFVTQDTQLFSGSIRENLLFVNPTATDAECLEVLRRAACDSLLARADRGLDTVIGEGGVKVSGGEKQRLSIARALLRRPRLLVFDEATSSLDSLTEEEITETIREVASSQVITILIAHRLSTVLHADTIHVLEHGRIVESGRHSELLERKGLYYAMWRQQVGERRPAGPARLAATAGGEGGFQRCVPGGDVPVFALVEWVASFFA